MKLRQFRSIKSVSLACAAVLFLVSWTPPPGSDTNVNYLFTGTGNVFGGYTGNISGGPSGVNVSAFRGISSGNNNVTGTSTSGHYSAVIGNSNYGNAYWSFVGGTQNKIALTGNTHTTSARMLGIFGDSSVVENSSTRTLVSGFQNTVNSHASLVSGTINSIVGPSGSCSDSAALGYFNVLTATKGWAVGDTNTVRSDKGVAIGCENIAGKTGVGSNQIQRAMAIGTGVRAEVTDSTALGRYNATMASNDVVAIGSGSDDNNRFTALRVTDNGDVILGKAQGDISMGQYGN